MNIAGIELRWVRLPLVTPFQTSLFTEYERVALLVRVRTVDGASGWGECAAMPEPIYSTEDLDSAVKVLREKLIPLVQQLPEVTAEEANKAFRKVAGHPMAKAALETALLDAQLRLQDVSLARYLGAVHPAVKAGVSVGIMSRDALLEAVDRYWHKEQYQRIKLKIQPGWDEEPVRLVREFLGPHVDLTVDANGAYTLDDADHLARLDDYDLMLIEQPLAADDLAGHAKLARLLKTRICLDEPITSAADAIRAIECGAASIINIKPGRVGGYLEAREIHNVCAQHDVPVWVGGMLETGIGRAANVALAALPHFTLVGDLSASERFFEQDITPPVVMNDGLIQVPNGPGIGTDPDPAALRTATQRTQWIRFPVRSRAAGRELAAGRLG